MKILYQLFNIAYKLTALESSFSPTHPNPLRSSCMHGAELHMCCRGGDPTTTSTIWASFCSGSRCSKYCGLLDTICAEELQVLQLSLNSQFWEHSWNFPCGSVWSWRREMYAVHLGLLPLTNGSLIHAGNSQPAWLQGAQCRWELCFPFSVSQMPLIALEPEHFH